MKKNKNQENEKRQIRRRGRPVRVFSGVGRSAIRLSGLLSTRRAAGRSASRLHETVRSFSDHACSDVPHPVTLFVFQVQRWVISLTALFFYTIQNTLPLVPTGKPIHLITLPQEQSIPFTHRPTHFIPFIYSVVSTSVRDKFGCESCSNRAPFAIEWN